MPGQGNGRRGGNLRLKMTTETLKQEGRKNGSDAVKCFACGEQGHIARYCFKNGNQENKPGLDYVVSGGKTAVNAIAYEKGKETWRKAYDLGKHHAERMGVEVVRTGDGKKRKVAKTPRDDESEYNKQMLENIKDLGQALNKEMGRKQGDLEEWVERFPRVFKGLDREVEYCTLEKCKIETEIGKTMVKKGQTIPYALKERTRQHIEDLERRRVIRRSCSNLRNPIRAIEKPNGDVRLVCNFMALNDPYELARITDVVRAVQGSKVFTVIDL